MRRSPERGATILEAALVLPVFFLLIMAIFECGLVMSSYHTMVGAVREGARVAVIPNPNSGYALPTPGTVADKVCQKLKAGVFGPITTCANYPGGTPNASATCPPFAGGTPPKLTAEDVYYKSPCTITDAFGGKEQYVEVAVHRTLQLFWGWKFPLTARAFMRSERN